MIQYVTEDDGDRVQHLDTTAMDGHAGTIRAVDPSDGAAFVRFDHGYGDWFPRDELVVYLADDENDGLTDEDLDGWHAELAARFHKRPVEPGRTVVRGIGDRFHGVVHGVSNDGQQLYVVVYGSEHEHGWMPVLDLVRVRTADDVDGEVGAADFHYGDLVCDEHVNRVGVFDLYTHDGFAQVSLLDSNGDVYYPPPFWLRLAGRDELETAA